jgi:hypothetical protein
MGPARVQRRVELVWLQQSAKDLRVDGMLQGGKEGLMPYSKARDFAPTGYDSQLFSNHQSKPVISTKDFCS